MIEDLERIGALGAEIGRRARSASVLSLFRVQVRSARRVFVRDGRAEDTAITTSSGYGIQVFTGDGYTAFASRDDLRDAPALSLLDRTSAVAKDGRRLGLASVPAPDLSPVTARAVPEAVAAFHRVGLRAVTDRLREIEAELRGRCEGVRFKLSYASELDAWRIFRSDGSDVLFAMPRCVIRVAATSTGGDARHSVGASVSGPESALPWSEAAIGLLLRRSERAAWLAAHLPDAPTHPAGSFPFVIDYALAKGLAHEAFGHAAEADGFRSSVLAREGRFRAGEEVGASHVSILDEPVEGDHAWQPYSSNALPRTRAVIVDHGRLCDALADPWSAGPAGARIVDAARAESFRRAPLPRMSNIRIEADRPLAAPGEFEDYGPDEVRDLLASAGVLKRHPAVVFLSGYSGGQVNTASGDFVFGCKAIYRISRDRITFHKPAAFAGSMFGALRSIREAFGPLRLDALGTCGKWGQSVPSSGGSHYFLVLDPEPSVRLAGE
jgi:TldD protein